MLLERDGRTPAAVRVADRAGLAGRDDERVARAARRVAGGAGVRRSFAIVQFLWSNYVGPELVDIVGGLVSLGCLALFCTWWQPAEAWEFPDGAGRSRAADGRQADRRCRDGDPIAAASVRAWMPWVFLSVFVTAWGIGPIKAFLNAGPAGMQRYRATGRQPPPHPVLSPAFDVPGLHRMVFRDYPVEADAGRSRPHDTIRPIERRAPRRRASRCNWLSATGTAILLAALATVALPARSAAVSRSQIAGADAARGCARRC